MDTKVKVTGKAINTKIRSQWVKQLKTNNESVTDYEFSPIRQLTTRTVHFKGRDRRVP